MFNFCDSSETQCFFPWKYLEKIHFTVQYCENSSLWENLILWHTVWFLTDGYPAAWNQRSIYLCFGKILPSLLRRLSLQHHNGTFHLLWVLQNLRNLLSNKQSILSNTTDSGGRTMVIKYRLKKSGLHNLSIVVIKENQWVFFFFFWKMLIWLR